jgi:hypothetical protein
LVAWYPATNYYIAGDFHAPLKTASAEEENLLFREVALMSEKRSSTSEFSRAFGNAKKQAAGVASTTSDAAQDLYQHASDSATEVRDAASKAARKTATSFEIALRNTIEQQPYTAVMIALGVGWLPGRMHRPL